MNISQTKHRPKKTFGAAVPARPTPARRTAFQILLRVETESSFATDLLNSRMAAGLDERDAALATELVLGTLRWQGTLDFIAQQLAPRWSTLDPEVRAALRMGLYQLWFLCRIRSEERRVGKECRL